MLFVITSIVLLLFWSATVRYDTQMFQQNSYRTERYLRWIKENPTTHYRWVSIPLCVITFFSNSLSATIFTCIVLLFIAIREFKTTYKKPIVYTARVIRLLSTTAAIIIAIYALSAIYAPDYALPIMMLSATLSFALLILSNLCAMPIEKLIIKWYYHDAQRLLAQMPNLIIIGITGSYGKTSTKHYLYRILSEKYNCLMTPGNYNTTLGVVRTIREMLKPQHQIFIVEMGAKQIGDIAEICRLVHPSIGIITAIGEQHLETFKTIENIQKTKFELAQALPKEGLAVLNFDSESVASYRTDMQARFTSYGIDNPHVDYRAENINYTQGETRFDVVAGVLPKDSFSTRLIGSGNILNLLASIVVADHLGVPRAKQQVAVRQIVQIEHRLTIRRTAAGIAIIDDAYNSNPAGAKMALDVLRRFNLGEDASQHKRIVVTPGFVELGTRQYDLNYELGRDISQACDYAIVVNATNRDAIVKGLHDTNFAQDKIFVAESFAEASQHLATIIKSGDVVLYENDLPDSFK